MAQPEDTVGTTKSTPELPEDAHDANITHQCHERKEESKYKTRLWPLSYLPLYIVFISLLAAALMSPGIVNGWTFPVYSASIFEDIVRRQFHTITQSDIILIITFHLRLCGFIAGAWQALIAWRCTIALLADSGLKIRQMSRTAGWKVPPSGSVELQWRFLSSSCFRGPFNLQVFSSPVQLAGHQHTISTQPSSKRCKYQ